MLKKDTCSQRETVSYFPSDSGTYENIKCEILALPTGDAPAIDGSYASTGAYVNVQALIGSPPFQRWAQSHSKVM
jgi:hypothetical protein